MIQYIIYGKTIIDEFELPSGLMSLLGGGGPQGAFGARLWDRSVGLLTRTGTDIEPTKVDELRALDVNLDGWQQFPDIPTARILIRYDENQSRRKSVFKVTTEQWIHLLNQPLSLPETFKKPAVFHLITGNPTEQMVDQAAELQATGSLLSLEPLIDRRVGTDRNALLALIKRTDIATPEWPLASDVAGSDDPLLVMKDWTKRGPALVAIRHGIRGSYLWSREEDRVWHLHPLAVQAVDPTGAGNAYGGGLCVGWHTTRDARLAGAYASISAGFMIRQHGMPIMTPLLEDEARSYLDTVTANATLL